MFTQEILDRFRNPKNTGKLKHYNSVGKAGDPSCSDFIELFVRFSGNIVDDASFNVFGCPGAISTTDVFIDLIRGKSIDKAMLIKEKDISNALGGLPLEHMHCSKLPIEAFNGALEYYKNIDEAKK